MPVKIVEIPELNDRDKERFWSKVDMTPGFGPDGDCWEWTGCTARGYGYFSIKQKMYRTNRISLYLRDGKIPDGLYVCHACDNRACVRPSHLWTGTNKDNSNDRDAKGRGRPGATIGSKCGTSKLDEEDVLEIRTHYRDKDFKQVELAEIYGVSHTAINNIVLNKVWKHVH